MDDRWHVVAGDDCDEEDDLAVVVQGIVVEVVRHYLGVGWDEDFVAEVEAEPDDEGKAEKQQ